VQQAINAVATVVNQSLNLEQIFETALDKVMEVTGCERGHIRLKNPATDKIKMVAHRGMSKKNIEAVLHLRSKGGKCDQVIASGEVLVRYDPKGMRVRSRSGREEIHSNIWVPLKAQGKVVGILNASTSRPNPFVSWEKELFQAIGNEIGVALEKARLYQETLSKAKELSALYSIAKVVNQSLDIGSVLRSVMHKVQEIMGFDAARLYIFDEDRRELCLLAHDGFPEDAYPPSSYKPGQGIVGTSFETAEPFFFENIQSDPQFHRLAGKKIAFRAGFRGHLTIPMGAKGKMVGVIQFLSKEVHHFSPEEVGLIHSIADHVGIAVENAQLYEQTKKQAVELVKSIGETEAAKRELEADVAERKRVGEGRLLKQKVPLSPFLRITLSQTLQAVL